MFLEDDSMFAEPDKPVPRWTIAECTAFLSPRRLDTNGRVAELRARVLENRTMPIPPPLGGSAEELKLVILSLWNLNSHLMGMDKVKAGDVNKTERMIRTFLTSLEDVDAQIRQHQPKQKHPMWVSQYNFASMLNIPWQIEQLGPIRNRWEGGARGEAFVRYLKPVVQSRRKNWQRNVLTNLLKQKTLHRLKDSDHITDFDDDDDHMEEVLPDTSNYHTYASLPEVLFHFSKGKPLSGLVTVVQQKCEFGVVYKAGDRKSVVTLQPMPDLKKYQAGLWYYAMDVLHETTTELAFYEYDTYGLLLPIADLDADEWPPPMGNRDEAPEFAVIASDWRCMLENGTLGFPDEYLRREYMLPTWRASNDDTDSE